MNSKKITVFILHGWSLDKNLKDRWQPLTKLLLKSGYEVNYLPLPGFDLPLEKALSLNDYENHVLKSVRGFDKVVLLGHSFGGQIAVKVAAANPENLKALVLIAPAGIIDKSICKQTKRVVFKIVAKVGSLLLKVFGQSNESSFYKFLQQKLHFAAREKDYLHASKELKQTMQNALSEEIEDDLTQVLVPTLIFWGDRDSFTPVKHAAIFASKIPQAKLKVLKKERHRPYFTQPEFIASNIISFIQKNES